MPLWLEWTIGGDTGSGFYYLNARYYDPRTGRFISPDDTSILDQTRSQLNGLNLYMYCGDNPVMMTDNSGRMPQWLMWLLGIGVVLVVGAVTVLSFGAAGIALGGMAGAIIHGAAVGTLIGTGIGSAVGVAGGAIYSSITGAYMGQSILYGFIAGFGIGAISGAVIGGSIGGVKYYQRGFGLKEIDNAIKIISKDSNKMNHIMNPKHLLKSEKETLKYMKKALWNGKIIPYKNVSSALLKSNGFKVIYKNVDGILRISDAWVEFLL